LAISAPYVPSVAQAVLIGLAARLYTPLPVTLSGDTANCPPDDTKN
jgi:hypothetical protein